MKRATGHAIVLVRQAVLVSVLKDTASGKKTDRVSGGGALLDGQTELNFLDAVKLD